MDTTNPFAAMTAAPAPDPLRDLVSSSVGLGISGLAGLGNLLDLPGSVVRDVVTLNNPLDQFLTPFSHQNRTTGRGVLAAYGLTTPNDPNAWEWSDVAGFGAELALDPLFYMSLGANTALGKGGQAIRNAGLLDDVTRLSGQASPYASRMQVKVGDVLENVIKSGDELKLADLQRATAAAGYNSLDEFAAARGGETVGGLVGLGLPFANPVAAFGTGPRSQAAARVFDNIFGPLSYGLATQRAVSEGVDPPITSAVKGVVGDRAGEYASIPLEAAATSFDAFKRKMRQWFDPSVKGEYSPVAQATAHAAYLSEKSLGAQGASRLRQMAQANSEAMDAYHSTIGEQVWDDMVKAPVAVDEQSLRELSSEMAAPDLFAHQQMSGLLKWKSENPGAVRQLDAIRRAGGDYTQFGRWDELKDQLMGADFAPYLSSVDDVDGFLFDFLTSKHTRPRPSDFRSAAVSQLVDEFDGFRNGATVRVSSPKLKQQAAGIAATGGDLSNFTTELVGLVTEAGTKQSRVMVRNPNTGALDEIMIPNERLVGELTGENVRTQMRTEYLNQRFSDMIRMAGESKPSGGSPVPLAPFSPSNVNFADEDLIRFARESQGEYMDRLPDDVARLVGNSGAKSFNGWQTNLGKVGPSASEFNKAVALQEHAASAPPIPSDLIAVRQLDKFPELANANVGDQFALPITTATSINPKYAQGGSGSLNPAMSYIQFEVPAGSRGLLFNANKRVNIPKEHELLLPIGTRVQVTGRDVVNGVDVIKARVIPGEVEKLKLLHELSVGDRAGSKIVSEIGDYKNSADLIERFGRKNVIEDVKGKRLVAFTDVDSSLPRRPLGDPVQSTGIGSASGSIEESIRHFTGEAGLARLTPEAQQSFEKFLSISREVKDTYRSDLVRMGVPIGEIGVEGDMINHLPRYLTKRGEKFIESRVGKTNFESAMDSIKGRTPVIREIPTHVVENDLLLNTRYRGENAAKYIAEDLEQYLDPAYLSKKQARADAAAERAAASAMDDTGSLADDAGDFADDSFDPRMFDWDNQDAIDWGRDAGDEAADPVWSKAAHAEDLAEWVKGHNKSRMFGNLLIEDLAHYAKQASRTQAMARGIHDTLASAAVESGKVADGVPLREVFVRAGFNAEEAATFFAENFGRSADNLVVPRDIAMAMPSVKSMSKPAIFEGPIAEAVDSFNAFWKGSVTSPYPAFHVRNHVSGQVHNVLSGGVDLTPSGVSAYSGAYRQSLGLMKRATNGSLTDDEIRLVEEMFDNGLLKENYMPAGGGTMIDDGIREVVPSNPMATVPTLDFIAKSRARAGESIADIPSVVDSLAGGYGRTVRSGYETIMGVGQNVGNAVEFMNRAPLYLYYRNKLGMSAGEAARKVNQMHFDYSEFTKMEGEVFKRLFPFWAFTRKMSELVTRDLMAKPGGRLAQVIRASRLAAANDYAAPEYVNETISIPLGQLPDGTKRYVTGLGLMHEAPLKMLSFNDNQLYPELDNLGVQTLAATSPLIKSPLEMVFGESLFQRGQDGGRDIDKMDPTIGRLISNVSELTGGGPVEAPSGLARPFVSPWFEHMASNAPGSRLFSSLRTLTDPRKYEGDLPGAAAAMNLLTGARVTDISPAAQDAVLRDTLTRLGEEQLDLRTFNRPYLSKDQIAEMEAIDPVKAEKQRQLAEAFKVLADRAKARKKAKEAAAAGVN